ncbi:transcription initiation factor TFIID subunit 4-like [Pongo pygmaeus]|uniref:transcription initiation factor TFIID subunit 4-like n=1 Tax=Pongo pygmaeus TaxID=9600 RepID=UPI00300C6305
MPNLIASLTSQALPSTPPDQALSWFSATLSQCQRVDASTTCLHMCVWTCIVLAHLRGPMSAEPSMCWNLQEHVSVRSVGPCPDGSPLVLSVTTTRMRTISSEPEDLAQVQPCAAARQAARGRELHELSAPCPPAPAPTPPPTGPGRWEVWGHPLGVSHFRGWAPGSRRGARSLPASLLGAQAWAAACVPGKGGAASRGDTRCSRQRSRSPLAGRSGRDPQRRVGAGAGWGGVPGLGPVRPPGWRAGPRTRRTAGPGRLSFGKTLAVSRLVSVDPAVAFSRAADLRPPVAPAVLEQKGPPLLPDRAPSPEPHGAGKRRSPGAEARSAGALAPFPAPEGACPARPGLAGKPRPEEVAVQQGIGAALPWFLADPRSGQKTPLWPFPVSHHQIGPQRPGVPRMALKPTGALAGCPPPSPASLQRWAGAPALTWHQLSTGGT